MRNIGERIAYWYLRLNGFFLIENFVHHKGREESDILGYKPRGAQEIVIGKNIVDRKILTPDKKLVEMFRKHGVDYNNFNIAVICEVSLSKDPQDLRNKFKKSKIELALNRLGLNEFLSEKIEDVPIKIRGNVALAKLFFSRSDSTSEDIVLNIPIACALKFIKERMKLEFKKEPWDLFDDPFIQYIILENIGWK